MPNTRVSRRQFVHSALAVGALAGLARPVMAAVPFEMGLQLYTVRDPMAKAPLQTLKDIAALGYRNLETFGFDAANVGYYGMGAAQFGRVLEDLGLRTTSGHYDLFRYLEAPLPELRDYVSRCAEGARALGQRYVTWPWLAPEQRTLRHYELLAERLSRVGEQLKEAGLKTAYHNHDFDFLPQDGRLGYDVVMQNTDHESVKLQLDLYWVAHSSGRTWRELFALQPGRFVMWHLKDMDRKTRDYTELGNGSIDYTGILAEAKLAGLEEYFVEQGGNFAVDAMQSIATCATWVKRNLK